MSLFNKPSTKKTKLRIFAGVIIFGLLAGSFWVLFHPTNSEAAWFDDSYHYRTSYSFTHNASLSNQRLDITINTSTLITAGKMQSDCDDSRFTDINGKVLRYQLVSNCNTTSTSYSIVLPTVVSGSNSYYFYYGNQSAVSNSDASVSAVSSFTPSGGTPASASEEKGPAPVLYWKLDEGSGSTVDDSSFNSNTGTLAATTSTPAWKTEDFCVSGKCLKFDGADDYLSRSYSSDTELDPGSSSFSVSIWAKHTTSLSGTDVMLSRFNGAGYILYMNSSGNICFGIDDDAVSFPEDSACSSDSFADNEWHNIQAVKNGTSSITLYVDGNQVGQDSSISANGSLSGSSPTLYVGTENPGSNDWDGFLDEVKIYDYAKSAAQVKTEYISRGAIQGASVSSGATALEKSLAQDLVGYWKMDESTANTCAGGVNDNCDSSGMGNDLSWVDNATSGTGKFGNGVVLDGNLDATQRSTGLFNGISNSKRWAYSLWFKTTDTQGYLFDTRPNGFALYTDGTNTLKIYHDDSGSGTPPIKDITYTATVTDGNWHHTVMTRDGDNSISLYVDGIKLTPTSYTSNDDISAVSDSPSNIFFGNRYTGNIYPLNGTIDEARVYKRALSQAEVSALYDWGPGPVGYWKFDDNTGTAAVDSSGNGNNGTLGNSASWRVGKYGSALDFNATNSYVSIPTSSSLNSTVSHMSISAWIFPKSVGENNIGRIIDTGVGTMFFRLDASNVLSFSIDAGTTPLIRSSNTNAITLNQWQFVTVTWDGSTSASNVHLYVNGKETTYSTTQDAVGSTDFSGSNFIIGNRETFGRKFDGYIDEVKIYNYERNQKQIMSDINIGHPAVGSAIGYWKLDEGQGTTAHNTGSLGSTLDGTISNAASPATSTSGWTNSGKFGKAFNFDDTDDIINMGSDSSIDNLPSLSVSAWVYPRSSGENNVGRIFDKTNGPNTVGWTLILDSNNLNFSVNYGTSPLTVITSATLPSNTWSYVTATWDGTSSSSGVAIYINGVKQTAFTQNDSGTGSRNDDSTASLYLGNVSALTRTFDGLIDEAKLYNYVLSQDEVKVDMNQGKSQVLGSNSTTSNGTTLDNSAERSYCVPGDTTSCTAPVAEWNFDENTGTSAKDTVGGNNLAGQNTPTWDVGKYGSAARLNGSNQYYCSDTNSDGICDSNTVLQLSGPMTVSFWANANTISDNARMIHEGDNTENQIDNTLYALYWKTTSGNDIEYTHETGAGVNSTITFDTNLSANTWYYFTLVRDTTAKTVSLYVNGKLISTGSYTNNPDGGSNGKFAIGTQYGATGYFDGKIDNVRIYNYARSMAQIAWDYNHGGPVGWWKLDECQGTTINDASGTGNNGTLSIGATGTYTSAGTCNSGTSSESWNAGTTGKYSSALGFDGTDDYINLNSPSSIQNNYPTISAWVKTTTSSPGKIVAYTGGAGVKYSFDAYLTASGKARWEFDGASASQSNQTGNRTINDGAWHNIVIKYDGVNGYLYVDGLLDVSNAYAGGPLEYDGSLTIGKAAIDGEFFNGLIDDVRIYSYPLTSLQIKTLYNENSSTRFGP